MHRFLSKLNWRFKVLNWKYIYETGVLKFLIRSSIRKYETKFLKKDQDILLPNKVKMHLPRDSAYAAAVFVTNCSTEWGAEALFSKMIEPGGCLLDVGANIGYYSLYLSDKVEEVYSFEPDPRVQKHLERNLKKIKKGELISKGVSSKEGRFTLLMGNEAVASMLSDKVMENRKSIQVDVTTLDIFVKEREINKVTAIKIDVEGKDFDVLLGAIDLIEKDKPLILIEFGADEDANSNKDMFFDFLEKYNYACFGATRPKAADTDALLFKKPLVFREMTREIFDDYIFAMLFLVPENRQASFREFLG